MKIIALVNHKGGVGKTTTTLNLGKSLSLMGKKVLLIDLDPQANLSQSLGIREPENTVFEVLCENQTPVILKIADNFDLLPADLSLATADYKLQAEQFSGYTKLRKMLQPITKNYDYILIDCPPSLGILTVNALAFATDMLIIAEPEYLSITGLQTILELHGRTLETLNANLNFLGIVFTQFNRSVVGKGIIQGIKENYPNKVFETVIRENVKLSEASIHKKDIFAYDNTSIGAKDYELLANEILTNLTKNG
jgi:chromosome partitioning protein